VRFKLSLVICSSQLRPLRAIITTKRGMSDTALNYKTLAVLTTANTLIA